MDFTNGDLIKSKLIIYNHSGFLGHVTFISIQNIIQGADFTKGLKLSPFIG